MHRSTRSSSLRLSSSVVTERVGPADTDAVMRSNGRVCPDDKDGIKFVMLRQRNAEIVRKAIESKRSKAPTCLASGYPVQWQLNGAA